MIGGRATALLGRLWRQHRVALAALSVGAALFEFVITRVAPTPGQVGFLGGLLALLPSQVTAFAEGELALASPAGVIAFGYVHPFFVILFSAWTIRVATGALAGEIGRGTMDLLAARPVPRWAQALAAWAAVVAGLAALACAAWAGTAAGLATRSIGVAPLEVVGLPALAWLLYASWAGVALSVSAMCRDSGAAVAWTSGIIATSFALEFLARVWEPLTWTRPFLLFAYYRPQDVVGAGIDAVDAARLAVVGLAGVAAAVVIFGRRDL